MVCAICGKPLDLPFQKDDALIAVCEGCVRKRNDDRAERSMLDPHFTFEEKDPPAVGRQ